MININELENLSNIELESKMSEIITKLVQVEVAFEEAKYDYETLNYFIETKAENTKENVNLNELNNYIKTDIEKFTATTDIKENKESLNADKFENNIKLISDVKNRERKSSELVNSGHLGIIKRCVNEQENTLIKSKMDENLITTDSYEYYQSKINNIVHDAYVNDKMNEHMLNRISELLK